MISLHKIWLNQGFVLSLQANQQLNEYEVRNSLPAF